jgi:transcriptional regulator with XRE-family HTH domain
MKRHDHNSKEFGKRLKTLRIKKGLSSKDIAQGVPVASSTYREWENGRAITGLPYARIAEVLEISLTELFISPEDSVLAIRESLLEIEQAVKKIRSAL